MLILCYHELADDEATPWRLKPSSFREHLDALSGRTVGRFTDPATEFAITFDDGCSGFMDAGRWMTERGITGYFYITPGYIDGTVPPYWPTNFLTWDQVRALSRDHIIGAHSMTHPPQFLMLSPDEQRSEMAESKRAIEDQIGKPCVDWATPHGYVDAGLQQIARDIGFQTIASTNPGRNCPVDLACLQRFEIHSPCPAETLREVLSSPC